MKPTYICIIFVATVPNKPPTSKPPASKPPTKKPQTTKPSTESWQKPTAPTRPSAPTRPTRPTTTTRYTTPSTTSQFTEAASADIQEGCMSGAYYPHDDCSHFYVCFNDQLVAQSCAPGLMYNVEEHMCDWSFKVKCGNRKKIAQRYTSLYRSSLNYYRGKTIQVYFLILSI